MKHLLLTALLLTGSNSWASQTNLDSLWLVWQNEGAPDTTRCKAIDDLAWDGFIYNDSDSALVLANLFLEFAIYNNLARQECMALNTIGSCYWVKADYLKAVNYFERSLSLSDSINNKHGIASALNNLGGVYADQGYNPKALKYFERSMVLHEEMLDTQGIAVVTSNIGSIYQEQGEMEQAFSYKQKSLELYESIDDKFGIAIELMSIGSYYANQNDYQSALDYFLRAIAIREEINDKHGLVAALEMTGSALAKTGKIEEAIAYQKRSLQIADEIGNQRGYAISLMEYGTTLMQNGDYSAAIYNCKKSYNLLRELSILRQQKKACNCLYKAFKASGDVINALKYYELQNELQDSLQLIETAKKLQQMEFEKLLLADSAAHYAKDVALKNRYEKEVIRELNFRNIALICAAFLLLLAFGLYRRTSFIKKSNLVLQRERDRSNELLLNILPSDVARELKETGESEARDFEEVTVLFTDFKAFTQTAEKLSAKELVTEVNACFQTFDSITEKYNIEKIKTIGDAYMAAGGLQVPKNSTPKDVILAAIEMQQFMIKRKRERTSEGLPSFEMRVGVHSGPVVAGIVGVKKFQYDIWGDTVNTASRMESSGDVGKVNISHKTYELIKGDSNLTFESRGKIEVKGKGEMEMWFVQFKA